MTHIPFSYESATGCINVICSSPKEAFVNAVYSRERRQGHASVLMQMIVDHADDHDYILHLTVQGYGNGVIMDNPSLVEFYARFGFVRVGKNWPATMIRYPREKYMSHNET